MHLSPLQSRLVASLAASCLLILLYLILFPPDFALAAELSEAPPVVTDDFDLSIDSAKLNPRDSMYEPEFSAFDKSITGRAPEGITQLTNDEPMPMNLEPGSTQIFVFAPPSRSSGEENDRRHELRGEHNTSKVGDAGAGAGAAEGSKSRQENERNLEKRQGSQTVYISANTCQRPQAVEPSKTTKDPPQLTLFVSTTAANQAPGPLADEGSQEVIVFKEGAVMYSFDTNGEVYLGVYAPDVSESFSGPYNVRIAVSTDSYYYSYDDGDDNDLIWVDSDSQKALLITHNLTDSADPNEEAEVMNTQPYVLFAHNKKDRAINGLKYSYCGLYNYAQIAATKDERSTDLVRTGMTKRGPGNLPKQQFFFTGLNSSAEYFGILARDGRAGGHLGKRQAASQRGTLVLKATNFSTKSYHDNCALISDLTFCDQIAYSVPSNPNFGNSTKLAEFYDNYARSAYANFEKSLAQVACDGPSSQRYSLARNCTDCAAAYKDWLCSVAIPRCEDFSNTASYLQPRAIDQPFPNGEKLDAEALALMPKTPAYMSSRNPLIDDIIKPGPHKELLPCDDLCHKLVQSCPASMEFGCPLPGTIGFAGNYAKRDTSEGLTCNFPGSAHFPPAQFPSAGGRAVLNWGVMAGALMVGLLMV
ncbi:stretch-activated Ca-permeable channel [Corynascus similis CBS 632.67]